MEINKKTFNATKHWIMADTGTTEGNFWKFKLSLLSRFAMANLIMKCYCQDCMNMILKAIEISA